MAQKLYCPVRTFTRSTTPFFNPGDLMVGDL